MLVKLLNVSNKKEDYYHETEKHLFDIFTVVSVVVGEIGLFNKLNSEDFLQTSTVEKVDIIGSSILVETKNSKYTFKVI